MDTINELQNIWQNQNTSKADRGNFDAQSESLMQKISRTAKKTKGINRLKTVLIIIIISTLLAKLYLLQITGLYLVLGISLIVIGLGVFLILYWNKQFSPAKLHWESDSKTFLESSLNKLYIHKKYEKKLVLFIVLVLITGLNLIYIDLLKDLDTWIRMVYHLGFSGLCIAFYFLGMKMRYKLTGKQIDQLISELENIIQKFEEA